MSIFGTIMSKVFGESHPAANASPTDQKPPGDTAAASSTPPAAGGAPASAPPASGASTAAAPATAPSTVDIAEKLDGMESNAGQTLDWRHSIVDLMKLLGMDSSLTARKDLAKEMHYTGDTEDSASMNMWLHKEVMAKFAQNGGTLPKDLHA